MATASSGRRLGWVWAVVVACIVTTTACSHTDSAARAGPAATASARSAHAVLSPGGGTLAGFRVLRTISLKTAAESVFTFGDWVVWSAEPVRAAGGQQTVPTEYDALNVRTGGTATVHGHEAGAILNFATGAGDTLVAREVVPQPADACASPMGCFRWSLWSTALPGGQQRELARSVAAVAPSAVPIPDADGAWAAWQEVDGRGRVLTVSERLDASERHVLATGPAASAVNVDGQAVYLDDGTTKPPRLLRVPVAGGPLRTVYQATKFYRPGVNRGVAALVAGLPTEGMRVLMLNVGSRPPARVLYRSNEIYYAWPISESEAVVRDFQGVEVARGGASPVTLSTAVVGSSAVAVAGHEVSLLLSDGTHSKIETVDVTS